MDPAIIMVLTAMLAGMAVLIVLRVRQRRRERMIRTIWIKLELYRPIPHSTAIDMKRSLFYQLAEGEITMSDPRVEEPGRSPIIHGIRFVLA